METLSEKIESILMDKFQEEPFKDLFLVEVKQNPGDKIQVLLDSDSSVSLGQCARISRHLENHIEEQGWLSPNYSIEVSSAGVGAPLKLHRQYVKNIGRQVKVEVIDDHKAIKGALTKVEEDSITVEYEEKVKVEGRKKKEMKTIVKKVDFENIKSTSVLISFK